MTVGGGKGIFQSGNTAKPYEAKEAHQVRGNKIVLITDKVSRSVRRASQPANGVRDAKNENKVAAKRKL